MLASLGPLMEGGHNNFYLQSNRWWGFIKQGGQKFCPANSHSSSQEKKYNTQFVNPFLKVNLEC